MENFAPYLSLGIGLCLGALAAWALYRGRAAAAREQGRAERLAEIATLQERLVARTAQIESVSEAQRSLDAEVIGLRRTAAAAQAAAAAAEARAARVPSLEASLAAAQARAAEVGEKVAELQADLKAEREATAEKLALVDAAQTQMSDAFSALSAAALKSNNQAFLDLAKTTLEGTQAEAKVDLDARTQAIDALVKPLKESLEKVDSTVRTMEKQRTEAYGSLSTQLETLSVAQGQLHRETSSLAQALRAPTVRGRWGEIQLKRVVEMAGMVEHCDFVEQQSVRTEEGSLKPDMLIKLPGGKLVVVDSKAPLGSYLEATEAQDEAVRRGKLTDHAKQIRRHLLQLAQKAYWRQFEPTPEFVVMFLPGEVFFSAALEQDPGLIELGVQNRVILATPTTLVALLRAVAYGWQKEDVTHNAQVISDLGKELYERLRTMACHFQGMRKGLDGALKSYNQAVGSFESRVLVSARKLAELGAGTGDGIEEPEPIDRAARELGAGSVEPAASQAQSELPIPHTPRLVGR